MTNFVPIFPLEIVLFPDEKLNLHIFEPRYKQLIKECIDENKPFGVCPVIDGRLTEMGTLARVTELNNTYDDGTMDVKTLGIMPFKILEIIKTLPDKLYQGAIVSYPNFTKTGNAFVMNKVLTNLRKIHTHLKVNKDFGKPDKELGSFDVAHHAGLSIQDEYRLLELELELHRQEFLNRQLDKFLAVINEMNLLKEKIKLNGHFKNLKGFNY